MKSCRGCKFHWGDISVCTADKTPLRRFRNIYDGSIRTSPICPNLGAMRAPGGACGPDASMYKPRWYRRLFGQRVAGES
jgi:hypothetical protein